MFDIGWPEMAIVAVIALIIIGPRDLPRIMRYVGRWAGKARRMAREFQRSFDDMVRESEMDEIKKGVESVSGYKPAKEIENAIDPTGSLKKSLDPTAPDGPGDDGGDAKTKPADSAAGEAPAETGGDSEPPAEAPADTANTESEPAAEAPKSRASV